MGRHRRQTHLQSRVREKENKDAHQAEGGAPAGRDRVEDGAAGTWTRPRTKNGLVLVDSMTTKDGESGDVSSLGGWGTGGGRGKRGRDGVGGGSWGWSGGDRRAEGGRAADGDQWAPTLLSDQD